MLEYEIDSIEDHYPKIVEKLLKDFKKGNLHEDDFKVNIRPWYTTWVYQGQIVRTIHYKKERKELFEKIKKTWGVDLAKENLD